MAIFNSYVKLPEGILIIVSVFVMLVICDQLDYRKFIGKSTVRHITQFDESYCVLTSHHHFIYLNFQISRLWVAWKMFAGETCVGFVLSLPISVEIHWVAKCCKHVLVTTLQTHFKLLCFINVLKPITNHPFGNALHHLFMVSLGMVYYCFTHIIQFATFSRVSPSVAVIIWGFPSMGVPPIAGWFISWKKNPLKWMMTGGTPILGNLHLVHFMAQFPIAR